MVADRKVLRAAAACVGVVAWGCNVAVEGQVRPYPVGQVLLAVLAAVVGWSFCTTAAERTPKRAPAPKAAKAAGISRAAAPIGSTTLPIALVQAYVNNPQLNAQRANTRAIDENVSIALGSYRPRVTATSSIAEAFLDTTQASGSLRSASGDPRR